MQSTHPSSPDLKEYNPARRAFHITLINLLGAAIGLAMAIPTRVYLLTAPHKRGGTKWIDAGDVSQLTPGTPVEMSFRVNRLDGWRMVTENKTAWVVKSADSEIVAFGPQCTHLGCAYHVDNGRFLCPCHTSIFSTDGQVVAGPAPRPLDRYETKIENERLQIGDLKQKA